MDDPTTEPETLGSKIFAWTVMAAFFPGFIPIADGLGAFARGVVGWLKFGEWPKERFWSGILRFLPDAQRPYTDWVVPDRIINWVLDGPRWFWMSVAAVTYYALLFLALLFGASTFEKVMKRIRG